MANVTRLFDTLRDEHDIRSDAALARKLDLAPSDICRARKKQELSNRLLVRISERFSMPISQIRNLAT
jgi:hypothetical protein